MVSTSFIISVISSLLLGVSETLPFIKKVKNNGIIHTFFNWDTKEELHIVVPENTRVRFTHE